MDFTTFIQAINTIDAGLTQMKAAALVMAQAQPDAAAAVAALTAAGKGTPPATSPGSLTNGPAGSIATPRVDALVPPGTPNTITLPNTGHTLSLPQPNAANPQQGEMFVGYCMRVSGQCHGMIGEVGKLFMGDDYLFAPLGGFKTDGTDWPVAADAFFNPSAYSTPEQIAAAVAAQKQWDATEAALKGANAAVAAASGTVAAASGTVAPSPTTQLPLPGV